MDMPSLRGCVVMADALNTQKFVATKAVAKGSIRIKRLRAALTRSFLADLLTSL
jgi:hypothetical protein